MGCKPPTICRMLREEGLIANRTGIHQFLQKHREMNNIERRPGSSRPTKMMAPVKALVEQRMRYNDETTAVQLHALLLCHGHTMTLKTGLRCRAALGWMFRGSANCSSLFNSAINRFVIVFSGRFRTVRPFRLNRWGVSYNGKSRSIFVS